jgi:multidrug efflux system outer membrane protein
MTKSIHHRSRTLRSNLLSVLALASFLLPVGSKAQEPLETPIVHPLSLHECIALALQESPTLEAGRFELAAATEEVRAAKEKLLPRIDGAASYLFFSGSPANKFSIVNVGTGGNVGLNSNDIDLGEVESYSAHLSYPLFKDGSILGLNNGPAVAGKEARKRNLAWTNKLARDQVIDRITDTFVTTVSAQNRAGYAARRVKLLQELANITEEQQKQGLSLPIDLKVAQGQLKGAQTLAKILREQAVAGSIELSRSLGLVPTSDLRLESTLPEPPEPPPAEKILGASLNQHPSLQVQRATIDQAKEDYKLERYRLYPSVNLEGSALYIDDYGSSNASIFAGGITVSVPIFDFGAQLSVTRAKLLKYKAERARLLSVADDVTAEVVKTYQEIYVLSQNILTLQDKVAKNERDLQVTTSQQQQGIAPPLTAVEQELKLIAKRDDLDSLMVRRLILYSALQKAAGGSWQWIK